MISNENCPVPIQSGQGEDEKWVGGRIPTTQWYVLYTQPRAEKRVHERLQTLVDECYLPLHRAPRVWSDRIKIVEKPLFSSYIFVRCAESQLYNLLKVNGVVRMVYYSGKPAVLRKNDIHEIKLFLEQAANSQLCEGEEVEILRGAFKHISGKIRKIKKKYLLLYIEAIGSVVCVNTTNVAHINRIR
ncbi:MAG: UpxY family transcription antiterminator [Tannerella sp.]|jgi:transcription antitermination factor NusG|nr:UpxY family transcription antiterminator [Tannerella sp.]